MATLSSNDIKIRYVVETANLEAAANAFDKLTAEEKQALAELKRFNTEASTTNKSMGELGSIAGKVGGVLGGLFAVSQIKQFAAAVLETTIKFEAMRKAIDFASGSAEMGNKNFEFIRQTAQKLGLDLRGAVEGYKTFASAANLAGQSSQETNRQFAAVAKAAQVMGLSAEDTKGAFLALGQMMSKGNVQAEELRGQLGERLVGAFGIAAKAMGVTTGELNKMLQKGQVLAADFLPKFATELENTFGKGNTQVTTLAASQNRFNSSIDQLILAIGNKLNPFLKGAYDLAAGIAQSLSGAAGGGAAKQATADAIAARRTEAELAQKILDISIKQGIFISRQSAARALLGEIDQRITNAQLKQVDARLTKDNLRLQAATKEITILQEQEKIYEKIAGVIVTIPPPPKPVDPKELKKEYEERLKMLELLKEQRKLIGELYNDPLANIGAEKAFLEAKLKLQKQYAVLFTQVEIGNTNLQRLNAEKDFNQQAEALRMENYQSAVKSEEDLQSVRSKIMKDNLKNMEEDQKRQAEIVKEMTRVIEEEERRRAAIREKAFELGNTLVSGAFDIHQANLRNEMSLLQNRYDKEIELADGNEQKIQEINERKAQKEREIRTKQFQAEKAAAIANIIFELGQQLVKYGTNPLTAPLALLASGIAAAQIGFITMQPVPEFAEGTKGKPFKGGKAIVGERGVEKVVTESGKVYFTPPTATLVDLPKGSQVIPNHSLSRQELFLANQYANRSSSTAYPVVGEIRELGSILKALPITQLNMDERGFEKFIRTPRRSTKILNNRFGIDN
jgi:tape measure domain-containing protein